VLQSPLKPILGGRGDVSIKSPFATLKECLLKVPLSTGFNIEVKYPDALDSVTFGLNNAELNIFIDKILEVVFSYSSTRSIIFSSFHPEVCLMLNMKQPNYPVFFLTDGGSYKNFDPRCNSLREAVRFAKFAGLLGIVTLSDPICEAPFLIDAIKETGLLLFSYGTLNNNVKYAELQRKHGVNAVIVDKITHVNLDFLK
jgi:glycerophosphodiester phosphodiesterase